jgi:thymidylate synthase (FAD)
MNAMQDPLQDGVSSLSLENCGGSDLTVVNAARISYKGHSEELNDDDVRLLESMIKNGHKTPFEQTFMQFLVKAPIFVTRQWMRHRVGVSYNELSARYTKMDQEFYMPKHIADCEVMHKQYAKTLDACSLTYQQLLNSGIKREEARCILPVSLYTTFYFSCNLNSLFHFAELRFNSHAQWEIQQYAKAMLLLAQKQFPNSIDLWCKNRNLIIN